jgi:hypothetical protein
VKGADRERVQGELKEALAEIDRLNGERGEEV